MYVLFSFTPRKHYHSVYVDIFKSIWEKEKVLRNYSLFCISTIESLINHQYTLIIVLYSIITVNLDITYGLRVYRIPRMGTSGIPVQSRTGILVRHIQRNLSIHYLHGENSSLGFIEAVHQWLINMSHHWRPVAHFMQVYNNICRSCLHTLRFYFTPLLNRCYYNIVFILQDYQMPLRIPYL